MNQSFYTAAVGAQHQQRRLNIQGNNVANVNNYGFKAERGTFSSLLYGAMPGAEGDLPVGCGARLNQAAIDFSSTAFADTGRIQDYAIEGDGFFGLMDLATGEASFTRTGAFYLSEFQEVTEELDENGEPIVRTVMRLADAEGRCVLSTEGGLIEVTDPEAAQPIGVFDFVNCDGMQHLGGNRFLPVEKNGQLRFGAGTVLQGMLEMSNVDLADEITKVIESQRAYGLALKMVQVSDEIESTVNSLRT